MPATPDNLPADLVLPAAGDEAGGDVLALRTRLDEAHERINNLHLALETSRTIGIAMGIVVERGRVTPTQAFDLLVRISQKENRKLRDVAADLVTSGVIPTSPSHRG